MIDYAARITQKAIKETGSYDYSVVCQKVIKMAEKEAKRLEKPISPYAYLSKYYSIQTTGDIISAINQLRRQHDGNI
jgi:hypothetical protein